MWVETECSLQLFRAWRDHLRTCGDCPDHKTRQCSTARRIYRDAEAAMEVW